MSVTFGDVVADLLGLLEADWPGLEAGRKVPKPMPDPFVRLLRTGGGVKTRVSEEAHVSWDVWADTPELAHDTAQDVRTSLLSAAGRTSALTVYRVAEAGGPAELPDPTQPSKIRFVGTVAVHVRGTTT